MAGRKRGRPKKMSTANPERKPKKTQSALDLLHAQTVSRAASPSPQGECLLAPALLCSGVPGSLTAVPFPAGPGRSHCDSVCAEYSEMGVGGLQLQSLPRALQGSRAEAPLRQGEVPWFGVWWRLGWAAGASRRAWRLESVTHCLPAGAPYQLPPSTQRRPPEQLLLAPAPPALHRLLGEPPQGGAGGGRAGRVACSQTPWETHAAWPSAPPPGLRLSPARARLGFGVSGARAAV